MSAARSAGGLAALAGCLLAPPARAWDAGAAGWAQATAQLWRLFDLVAWVHNTVAGLLVLVAVFTVYGISIKSFFGEFQWQSLNTVLAAVVYLSLSGYMLGFVVAGTEGGDFARASPGGAPLDLSSGPHAPGAGIDDSVTPDEAKLAWTDWVNDRLRNLPVETRLGLIEQIANAIDRAGPTGVRMWQYPADADNPARVVLHTPGQWLLDADLDDDDRVVPGSNRAPPPPASPRVAP